MAAAPIVAGDRALGVLVVYAARPPAFTEDVLALITLLAEQAALVLRSHELLREAVQVQALAEMTRLKDDFLSVVAHDVRTPLTTILINAELLERDLSSDGQNGRRAAGMHKEAQRLKALVEDYLDIVSAEAGREVHLVPADLADIARDAVSGIPDNASRVEVTALGLGLYICRQIAEEHGGSISVSSRVGEGSTFHVSLPAAIPLRTA